MRSRISGFGMLALLVVVALVLLLVARAWERLAPAAPEVAVPLAGGPAGEDGRPSERDERMPGLTETMRRTDQHEERTREAMEKIP